MYEIAKDIMPHYFNNIIEEHYRVDFMAQRIDIQVVQVGYI